MQDLADAVSNGALAHLTMLFLNNNEICDEGVTAFAEAVKPTTDIVALPALQRLELIQNVIGDYGINALADAVSNMALPNCTHISLSSNPANVEAQIQVSDAIRSRKG